MMEQTHHDEPSRDDQSVLARLEQLDDDARDRREHERQARWQKVATEAEEMLRRLNRGEPVEAARAAPKSAESRPLQDVSDDELDLGSVPGVVEARRRGLSRALTSGERTQMVARRAGACVTRRGSVRSRGRREHRPGQRRTASASRVGSDGGSEPGEPDPPGAAGPGDDDWFACAHLSAAEAHREASSSAAAYAGSRERKRHREKHDRAVHADRKGGRQ